MPEIPKTLVVDFDGTLCDHEFPSIGKVKPGAVAAMKLFRQLGYYIVISSCRSCHHHYHIFGGSPDIPVLERERMKEMVAWLDSNEIPYDEIDDGSKGKYLATWYLDDRGLRVDNNWPQIAAFIYNEDAKMFPARMEE